ncbi:MAG: hypothetical protein Q9209_000400 [Squamulea sp. 1 TL-2023]
MASHYRSPSEARRPKSILNSSASVETDGMEVSPPSTPDTEHHILPTIPPTARECPSQVTLSPFEKATVHYQADTQQKPETELIAAATSLPLSRPTFPLAVRSFHQSAFNSYETSTSTSISDANPTTRASNPFEPTLSPPLDDDLNIPTVEIAELIGGEILRNLDTIPVKWTLTDMINHLIDNDILLPTEEQIDGNSAANAASLPTEETSPFYDKSEAARVDFTRANPGFKGSDDLEEIGESIYYEDPVTGRMKKRPGRYDLTDPSHPERGAAARANSGVGGLVGLEQRGDRMTVRRRRGEKFCGVKHGDEAKNAELGSWTEEC